MVLPLNNQVLTLMLGAVMPSARVPRGSVGDLEVTILAVLVHQVTCSNNFLAPSAAELERELLAILRT
jgi:hypothetical protein